MFIFPGIDSIKNHKKKKSKGSGKDLVVLLAFSFGFFTVRVFSAKPSFRCADRNLDGVALNYIPPEPPKKHRLKRYVFLGEFPTISK